MITAYLCRAIRNPFRGGYSKLTTAAWSIVIYLLSICAVIPFMYHHIYETHVSFSKNWQCKLKLDLHGYLTAFDIFVSAIPMIIICVVQTQTYKQLQRSARQFRGSSNRIRTMKRVFRTFAVVAAVFFLLTTPLSIFKVVFVWVLSKGKMSPIIPHTYHSLTLLMAMNSCANPLIYGRIHIRLLKLKPCYMQRKRRNASNKIELSRRQSTVKMNI